MDLSSLFFLPPELVRIWSDSRHIQHIYSSAGISQVFLIYLSSLSLLQYLQTFYIKSFPGGPVVKNLPANAGDISLIPGLGRFHIPWGN